MPNPSPNLKLLLNKLQAICLCGASTYGELAKFLGKPAPRVSEWISARKFEPSGEVALQMVQFGALKTLEIDAAGEPMKKAYREAFKKVCAEHPVEFA